MLDPAITLFGRRIEVKGDEKIEAEGEVYEHLDDDEIDKEEVEEESVENDQQDDSMAEAGDEPTNIPAMSETNDQTEKPIDSEKECEPLDDEKESNNTKNSEQKQLKKPDKILPCPRCNSMDTKFCYYNNYNVNQPRHFCKSCQRYWTAGGTMRNVPVGAGRRKNKSSASRYCHITVSEALQAARFDVSNIVHHPGLQTNGTVLTFGPDNPFCESITSVVNVVDKVPNGTTRNGFHNVDPAVPNPSREKNNREDRSTGSTVTTSSIDDQSKKGAQEPNKHVNAFANQIPCFQWPYMWNPAVPVPAPISPFCPSVFPVPIFHHPYWNGAPVPWNVPWAPPQCSPGQKNPTSNPTSPTLGKHTRDGEMVSLSNTNRTSETATTTTTTTTSSVLMPKTLRIDNPDEAAKSSIWSTLGIKKDKGDAQSKGFFNSFQPKEADKKDGQVDASTAFIKANPVVLCRSLSFQERA
ncbi:hypothetical protein vseg_003053 [Gypsophila vaccaria]